MSAANEPTEPRKSWISGPHDILLGFLALVLCYVPALIFGIGESPCFLFAGALFIAVIASLMARRSSRPLRVELIALALIVILSSVLSYWTAHPSPDQLFRMAFGVEPPAGVLNLRGRVQWYDGQTVLLRFNADEATLKQAMSTRKFLADQHMDLMDGESRTAKDSYVKGQFITSRIADPEWTNTIKFEVPKFWRWQITPDAARAEQTDVFVNEKNEVWVMYKRT